MIHHRERDEVRRFDIIKLIVLLVLIALLLWFWLSPPGFVRGVDNSDSGTAVAGDTDTGDTDTGGDVELPQIDVPELEDPVLTNGLEAGSVALSGSGTPGSTVRVLLDGVEVGTTEVGADGSWSFDLDMEAGSRTLSLEALDADGNVAKTVDFPTFDVSAPMVDLDIPTLNLPDGGLLGGSLTLGGSGTPGSEVGVVVDGELLGTTTVGADGSWSYDTDLAAGDYDVRLQAIDLDGNISTESDGFNLSLGELTLPDFDLPSFDFGAGDDLDISGVGTPGTTVELVADGEVVGTTVVGPDGTWSIPTNLDVGEYDLSLRMLAADGRLLAESVGRNVNVAAADGGAADFVLPSFNLPDLNLAGSDVTLTGIGTPGSEVEVVVNGEVVGTAVVGDDGTWSFPTNLPAGDYELALRTVDGSGTAVETDLFNFSLAAADIAAPVLDAPADGSSVESGELSFSGMGTPGSEVEILDGDEVIGTAVVGDDGTWAFSYTPDAGDHSYTVRNVGAAEASASSSVTVAAPAAADDSSNDTTASANAGTYICENPTEGIDQGDTYIVGMCEWLTRIANRLGIEYPALIGVNPQIEDPNLIYPGQVINLPPR